MKWFNGNRMRLVVVGVVAAILMSGGSAKADFTFGEPVNLGPTVNSAEWEYSHCVSADNLELYFVSWRDGGYGEGDIWVSTRETTEDEWGPPENLGPAVNSSYEEIGVCLSSDGLELYFQAWARPGGLGGIDIWVTRRTARGEPWGESTNLGSTINSELDEYNPCLSADGLELYFVFGRWDPEDAPTELNIGVTRRETTDDPWGEPVSLGPVVNSWPCQDTPWVSSDGRVLMFTDAWICEPRPGGYGGTDIWISRRAAQDSEWGEPVNLGLPINTAFDEDFPMISPDGSMLYFNSTRHGGSGGHDLWQAPILPVVGFDGDGTVGLSDLLMLVESWGTDDPLCDIGPMPWGDGLVNEADLEVLMSYWGQKVDYPARRAQAPKPADGSISDVEQAALIRWVSGNNATEHDVYVGMDPVAVEKADMSDTTGIYRGRQEASEYILPEAVLPGQTFYWRIDEFDGDTTLSKGQLWSFSVADYLIVDDMEPAEPIWQRWFDGWGDPNNGSFVDDEFTIVHIGEKSMSLFYDNSEAAISQIDRFWETPQDWTRKGVETLIIWLHGGPDNIAEPLQIHLGDSADNVAVVVHPDPTVLLSDAWHQWSIPLADVTGVNPTEIRSMTIVIGDNATEEDGIGMLYIDDMYLHPVSTQDMP